jgi:hypothetical protein
MAQQTEQKLTLAAAAEAKCRAALSDPTQKIRYNSGSVSQGISATADCGMNFPLVVSNNKGR